MPKLGIKRASKVEGRRSKVEGNFCYKIAKKTLFLQERTHVFAGLAVLGLDFDALFFIGFKNIFEKIDYINA